MSEPDKKLAIALPGEWAIQKAFGPALEEIGEDFRKLYKYGRDNIVLRAYRKIQDTEDGLESNIRVTRDVLWNGALSHDDVCAEYFGGVLAASRSEGGEDDSAINYIDTIKSMSSSQLRLHYFINREINKRMAGSEGDINVGIDTEIVKFEIFFAVKELRSLGVEPATDANILHRLGLLSGYKTSTARIDDSLNNLRLPYFSATITSYSAILYSVAHNRLGDWLQFSTVDFGDFPDIATPSLSGESLRELAVQANIDPDKLIS